MQAHSTTNITENITGTQADKTPYLLPDKPKSFNELNNVELGIAGESLAITLFKQAGYDVSYIACNHQIGGDLRVADRETGEVFSVEVKTARRNHCGRWRFCMYKAGKTDCKRSDICLLIAFDLTNRPYLYLIPSCLVFVTTISITSHPTSYNGKYGLWRNRGDLLDIDSMHRTAQVYQ
jgi:hypothetical protein